ncbi:unnamed protein product [Arctia plantaginis]|uniref:Uncharacterized protein n=1 Tax=Arctia plantaginis TaxID=874455 RepID=A0A8S1A430_ARCPL|nr:unnamed protein product [Arctia plantaginis]
MKSKLEEEPQVIDISKGGKGRKQKPNFDLDLPILYPTGRELSTAKIKDLRELLKLIPTDAKGSYNFLRNAASSDFINDTDGLAEEEDWNEETSVAEEGGKKSDNDNDEEGDNDAVDDREREVEDENRSTEKSKGEENEDSNADKVIEDVEDTKHNENKTSELFDSEEMPGEKKEICILNSRDCI